MIDRLKKKKVREELGEAAMPKGKTNTIESMRVADETLIEDGKDVDQEQIVRGLSIVANIGIIADSLDQNSPALTDVFTPDEPAKDKVLKVSPRKQTGKYWNKIKKSVRKYF